MKQFVLAALVAASFGITAHATSLGCPPQGYDRAQLNRLNAAHWQIASDRARNALARAMVACLADPDTALRDELAYNAFFQWMRNDQLSRTTLLAIGDELQGWLSAPEGDGYARPFAALTLSEFARTDRVHPWLTPARRQKLLDASISYFTNIRDYRGFDDHDGWRHGVAHGSDLMLQLSLNPAFGRSELTRIRDAVASQISPAGHFYTYGEPARLANPILYIAGRGVFTETEWTTWLAQVAAPAPLASWNDAFAHQNDLARVHNVTAFIETLYVHVKFADNTNVNALLPGTEAALKILP